MVASGTYCYDLLRFCRHLIDLFVPSPLRAGVGVVFIFGCKVFLAES
jgi:hypothetical protein